MQHLQIQKISLLKIYGESRKEIKKWIKDFRINNHNNHNLIKDFRLLNFQHNKNDEKPTGRYILNILNDEVHLEVAHNYIQLEKEQQSLEWKLIAFTVLQAILLFDSLYSYLTVDNEEESFSEFYKKQNVFISTFLKIKIVDLLYLNEDDRLHSTFYGLAFFINDSAHRVFAGRIINKDEGQAFNIYSNLAFNHKAALAIENSGSMLISPLVH